MCYDGPPVWILSPGWMKSLSKLPYTVENGITLQNVIMTMKDGGRVSAAVVGARLVELPEPYTCRDIKYMQAAR